MKYGRCENEPTRNLTAYKKALIQPLPLNPWTGALPLSMRELKFPETPPLVRNNEAM